jgi:hypothetical protein
MRGVALLALLFAAGCAAQGSGNAAPEPGGTALFGAVAKAPVKPPESLPPTDLLHAPYAGTPVQ